MALPVLDIVWPAALVGQPNGQLAANLLVTVPGQDGGASVTLAAVASRAWLALCAGARTAGYVLVATSAGDSYRRYSQQESLFRSRYITDFIRGRPYKTWNGQKWYQLPDTAEAAVPGTSNHGKAIAVDIGLRVGNTTVAITTAAVDWLIAHAHEYGWSAELQSERWHWRYVTGDAIPAAVLAYEAEQSDPDEEEQMKVYRINETGAVRAQVGAFNYGLSTNAAVQDALAMANQKNWIDVPAARASAYGFDLDAFAASAAAIAAGLAKLTPGAVTPPQLAAITEAARTGAEAGVDDALDGAKFTTTLTTE